MTTPPRRRATGRRLPTDRARAWVDQTGNQVRGNLRDNLGPVARRGPVVLLRRTWRKAWQDRIFGLSAEAAFWQLLSLPPLFLAVLGGVGYIGSVLGGHTIDTVERHLLAAAGRVFTPEVVEELLAPIVGAVLREGRADVVSIGFLLSLWAGSSATSTFVNTVTIAYDMRELRGAIHSRLLALALYLVSATFGVLLLPLLVLGPAQLVQLAPDGYRAEAAVLVARLYWPAVIVLVLVGLATFYHLAPPQRLPWRRGMPGAVLAMGVFILGGALLRRYITLVATRTFGYGVLAAPIAALLFLFLLAFAVLFGAELNAQIEKMWPSPQRRRWRSRLRAVARRRGTRAVEAATPDGAAPDHAAPDGTAPDGTAPDGTGEGSRGTSGRISTLARRTAVTAPADGAAPRTAEGRGS